MLNMAKIKHACKEIVIELFVKSYSNKLVCYFPRVGGQSNFKGL